MSAARTRKHPRVHEKKQLENSRLEENSIDLSAMAALGILILVFVKGIFWGYLLRKSMD